MNTDERNAQEIERLKARVKQRAKTFDSKCFELAQHFYPNASEAQLNELAADIQTLVEDSNPSQYTRSEPLDPHRGEDPIVENE